MDWGLQRYDLIAAELIRSTGMQNAKSYVVRLGHSLGRAFEPNQVKLDRISSWKDIVEQFLRSQGLTRVEVELQLNQGDGKTISGLQARIRFQASENESSFLLRPWFYAGWCAGYSEAQLQRELFFRVVCVPNAKNPYCELEGKEESAWKDSDMEPMVDYRRFQKSSSETRSLAMRICLDRLRDIAMGESRVFLQAEPCDGPDYLARYVHEHSERGRRLLVLLDARGLEENLFENALLTAAHGTLFIQSIEAFPKAYQRRLIAAILSETESLDIRLVVSSERSLSTLHREGRLLPELVRALQGNEVLVPSIRMRMEDLIPLARRILLKYSPRNLPERIQFSPAVLNEFLHYDWAGGIMELRNVIQTMLERRSEEEFILDTKHLPNGFNTGQLQFAASPMVGMTLAEAERKLILSTLQKVRGNKRDCSKILQIGYNTLWRKLRTYEASARRDRKGKTSLGLHK